MKDTLKAYVIETEGCPLETHSKICAALADCGIETLESTGKAALDEAYFLVLAAPSADKLDSSAEKDWQYFTDEIRWKRKSGGEAVIIDCSSVSFAPSKLPYALKKCKRFRLEKIDDAADYMSRALNETAAAADSVFLSSVVNKTSFDTAAVSLKSDRVSEYELNLNNSLDVSAHETPKDSPFTGGKATPKKADKPASQSAKDTASSKRESGACRDDHVFNKGDESGYKTLVRSDEKKVCRDDNVFDEERERKETARQEPFSEYPEYPVFKRSPAKKKFTPATIVVCIIIALIFLAIFLNIVINVAAVIFSFNVTALTQPLILLERCIFSVPL